MTKILRSYLIISLGLLCTAFGWAAFLIPSQVTGGGASGIAAVVYFATGISTGITYFVVNVVLLAIAYRTLGKSFAIKSIYGIFLFSVFLSSIQAIVKQPLVSDTFMATIIGSILSGMGIGITFTQGGSSGGTDIIAMMINQKRNITPGRVSMYLDVVIISLSYLVLHSVEKVIFGYCVMVISSYVLDLVLSGSMQSHQIMIFSVKYERIAERLSTEVMRGVTLLDGEGWYSKRKIKVVLILVRKTESYRVLRIAKEVDPEAFISMGQVMGVYGQGFEKIKDK